MLKTLVPTLALVTASASAPGADVRYTEDIQPVLQERCSKCHGAGSPDLETFKKNEKGFASKKTGPRKY